jgi:hypothetical protein
LIEDLTKQRQRAWSLGIGAADLTTQLERLYDRLRRERAAQVNGTTAEITRRARIERELERLGASAA